ncbi:ATP-binding protein [Streptomyces humi]|uniref:ATP-binding protein n=1 Tax=Streptomyces humi TaxID=1428620 RepID=UPI000628975C|nr:ATP-binding protein [Streptomyces humi]
MAESLSSDEVTFRLSRSPQSVPRSRAALHAALGGWHADQDLLEAAELVLSELVTNALRVPVPRDRQVGVRIARSPSEGLLRLEVSDAGSGTPEVRAPGDEETGGRGLLLVEAMAHRWGVEERAEGIGKTVWAELKAPDMVAVPGGREVAAAVVRPGQHVRVWGEWHVVLTVRTEPYAAGGLAVVLGLDEGPALRVPAAEPLAVRDGGPL